MRDSSTVFRFWKIHHQKGSRCRYDCDNGGNEDNLVIDILHDLIGFGQMVAAKTGCYYIRRGL